MAAIYGLKRERNSEERRTTPRYPLNAEVGYKVLHRNHTVETGIGQTVNMSTSGVGFEATHPLPVGEEIELAIAWPVRLGDTVRLKLCVVGSIVRSAGSFCAVQIKRHDFRIGSPQKPASDITRRL